MRRGRAALAAGLARALTACTLLLAPWCPSRATAMGYCNPPAPMSAEQQDRLFQFAAVIKQTLEGSGAGVALISRSGLDLSRFGFRYSHAGVSLKAGSATPWSVRQLYYACDEHRPRLYDQGMSAFVLGADNPARGYVSMVFLAPGDAAVLEHAAKDDALDLQLLGERYSANAYPYSLRYQNCNQWLVELLASAWRGLDGAEDARRRAQTWLEDHGYQPSVFEVGWRPVMWLSGLVSWLHSDDHPDSDIDHQRYRVSMPASIEAFVRAMAPDARRVEICHTEREIVVHRGWDPVAEGCLPAPYDVVVPFY